MRMIDGEVAGLWTSSGLHDEQSSLGGSAGMCESQQPAFPPLTKITFVAWRKMATRIFRKIVLSLGSLHLTLMAAIGIWFWRSPALFGAVQHEPLKADVLACTSISLLGKTINLSSSPLRVVSLVIYAFFAVPGLNLVVTAAFFFTLHFVYHRWRPQGAAAATPSVVPVSISLLFLLAVNIVFIVNIETTVKLHKVPGESQWTFGQTLAVLLLVLPLRDVYHFVQHIFEEKHHQERRTKCTQDLKHALEDNEMEHAKRMKQVKDAVKYADIRDEASGMSLVSYAVYQG
jgi:hypothetical protein